MWLYWPVKMLARLGTQIEFVQKQFFNSAPSAAIRSMFLISFKLPKEIYVATAALIAFVIDLTRIPTYIWTKAVGESVYYGLLPALIVVAYLGVRTGKLLLGKVSQDIFRKIVLSVLFLVGLKLFF